MSISKKIFTKRNKKVEHFLNFHVNGYFHDLIDFDNMVII